MVQNLLKQVLLRVEKRLVAGSEENFSSFTEFSLVKCWWNKKFSKLRKKFFPVSCNSKISFLRVHSFSFGFESFYFCQERDPLRELILRF